MDKPIIFLSHSSRDRKVLGKLKDLLQQKTANTVEIFLSSDGQSIPLGRNWIHKIEENLKKAKVMFVFLSPNSINSHWVYFESGFAYRQDIKVVPVGILGVDIGSLTPPMSLLQGFNADIPDRLNNILAIFNEEFGYNYAESFNQAEFDDIFTLGETIGKVVLGSRAGMIERIAYEIPALSSAGEKFISILDELQRPHQTSKVSPYRQLSIGSYGISMRLSERDGDKINHEVVTINMDPLLADLNIELTDRLIGEIFVPYPRNPNWSANMMPNFGMPTIQIEFRRGVTHLDDLTKRTARIYGTEIGLGREGNLAFRGAEFSVDDVKSEEKGNYVLLQVKGEIDKLQKFDYKELIEMLFDRGILFSSS